MCVTCISQEYSEHERRVAKASDERSEHRATFYSSPFGLEDVKNIGCLRHAFDTATDYTQTSCQALGYSRDGSTTVFY
jgi:hypothetical protein